MKTCFVVCPIGKDGSPERKQSDTLLKHFITPICEELDFNVTRVDQLNSIDNINSTIIEQLRAADLVIADMSGHNPNCFYEFGYRQSLGLPIIPLIYEGQTIPFDVSTLRTIHYATNDFDKAAETKDKLKQTILSIDFDKLPEIPNKEPVANTNILLTIQDKLDSIADDISTMKDTNIETILKYAKPQLSIEEKMLEMLLPELLTNPEAAKNINKISENLNKTKKYKK